MIKKIYEEGKDKAEAKCLELLKLADNETCDDDHTQADEALLELLIDLGCFKAVAEYKRLRKDHNFYYS